MRKAGRQFWAIVSALALMAVACSDDIDGDAADGSLEETSSEAVETTEDGSSTGPVGEVRTPSTSGPVTAGGGVNFIGTDVSSEGYVLEEFFIEGDAAAYSPRGDFADDGMWDVTEAGTHPFRTRIVVWRPADAADFNGTAFVEWFNVTAGFDNAPDWLMGHTEIVREGAVWVGVSAQSVGIEGGVELDVPIALPPLKEADPERYGDLVHPGDAFSYDIYTQAGVAVRGDGGGIDPLEGFDVERLIATGESQSAFRLTTYVNAVHRLVDVYDGYLIHSRRGTAAPLADDGGDLPDGVRIREDGDVPVLTFQTESELTVLGFAPARQLDSEYFRLWEVAGTAHIDAYTAGPARADLGDGAAELTILDPAQASGGPLDCAEPINAGGQHAVLKAAMAHLDRWVRDGTPPPEAPRIGTAGSGAEAQIRRDALGIAEGGVRTPIVDVPVAANDGEPNAGGNTCRLFGRTRPLDAVELAQRYPGGTAEYVDEFTRAVDAAVEDGFWLEPEGERYKAAARQITFG